MLAVAQPHAIGDRARADAAAHTAAAPATTAASIVRPLGRRRGIGIGVGIGRRRRSLPPLVAAEQEIEQTLGMRRRWRSDDGRERARSQSRGQYRLMSTAATPATHGHVL